MSIASYKLLQKYYGFFIHKYSSSKLSMKDQNFSIYINAFNLEIWKGTFEKALTSLKMSTINKTGGFKMAAENRTYHKISKLIGLLVLTFFLVSNSFFAQTSESEQSVELPEIAILNILNGIQSDNYGIKMSSIYLAGKYKIIDLSTELVKEMKISDNEDVCQMLVWSLYQIGDESCCQEMRTIIENHPSEKIKAFCESIYKIKQYDSTIEKSKQNNT